MRKSFLTHLLFVVGINLLVKPLYLFGVEVSVQNELGAESYGLYFALFNSAFLLQIINDFGIQIFNNRQISIDRSQIQVLVSGFLSLKLILSALYISLLVLAAAVLDLSDHLPLLLLIGVNLALTSFILFIRSGISGLGYYRIDSALSVLDKLLMLLIIGSLLLWSEGFNIYHFVFGQMLALILTVTLSWIILRRYASSLRLRWLPFDKLRVLLVKAMPYALVVFLMTLYTRIDGVMLLKLLNDSGLEAGVYAAGYRILDALNMVAFLFAALLLPMFSNAQSNPGQLRFLLDEGFRYMWLIVVPATIFGIFFRQEIMELLYTEADAYWGLVFALLISNFVLMGMMYIFGTLLTALGQIRSMNWVYAITVLLNVILNFALIPKYKASGAAFATLITQFFAVLGILLLCRRHIRPNLTPIYIFGVLGFFVFCILAAWVIHDLLSVAWYFELMIYAVFVLLVSILARIVRLQEVRTMLRTA